MSNHENLPLLLLVSFALCFNNGIVDAAALKIIGGAKAEPGEFPSVVSIVALGTAGNPNEHYCGGTLINMKTVITAAHCVFMYKFQPFALSVVAGAHYLRDAVTGIQQNRTINRITFHEHYEYLGLTNDIAILDLHVPFEPSATVGSLDLAQRGQTTSGQCLIAGWGSTGDNTASDELLKGHVTVHSKDVCSSVYPGDFDPNFHLCAGNLNGEGVDACDGDTGGPLICEKDGAKYFAGIISWGWDCGVDGKPGVYMEISKYRSWIDSNMNENPATTTPQTVNVNC